MFANAILPVFNIWFLDRPLDQVNLFIVFLLIIIVFLESLILKKILKSSFWKKHFFAAIYANILSTIAGSIIIFLYFSDNNLWSNYSSVIFMFFVATVCIEGLFYSFFYKKKLIWATIILNALSYLSLFILQLLSLFLFDFGVEFQNEKNKKEWEITDKFKKRINWEIGYVNRKEGAVHMFFKGSEIKIPKKIIRLSGEYALVDLKTEKRMYNILTKKNFPLEINRKVDFFSPNKNELNISYSKDFLEGKPDSKGWRKQYGISYKALHIKNGEEGRFVNIKNLYDTRWYRYKDGFLYVRYGGCKLIEKGWVFNPSLNLGRKECSNFHYEIVFQDINHTKVLLSQAKMPQLAGNTLFFIRENGIFKIELGVEDKGREVFRGEVREYLVSKDKKYLLVYTPNHRLLTSMGFLVLVSLETGEKYFLSEGFFKGFSFLEKVF